MEQLKRNTIRMARIERFIEAAAEQPPNNIGAVMAYAQKDACESASPLWAELQKLLRKWAGYVMCLVSVWEVRLRRSLFFGTRMN